MAREPRKVVGDLLEACDQAAAIVARGRRSFDEDEIHRLAAEAVLGRIGDAAKKLHAVYGNDLPSQIPWSEIIGLRIIVDHAYHKIDYGIVWSTLEQDVPVLRQAIVAWGRSRELVHPHFLDGVDAPSGDDAGDAVSSADREHEFHRAMVGVYEGAKREVGYTATRFIQMVSEVGGLDAARRLINGPPSDGFTALWEAGRLDLTVEALVLQPQFRQLFTQSELTAAEARLRDYGYRT
jgi:uncharacterized protein with HEPN domain